MSELDTTTTTKPQGKGMAITGFILALVSIVFGWIVYGAITLSGAAAIALGQEPSMTLSYVWIALTVIAVALAAMGMMKLGKTGGKRGLAIAGLIIGIVALVWTVMLHMGVNEAFEMARAKGASLMNM